MTTKRSHTCHGAVLPVTPEMTVYMQRYKGLCFQITEIRCLKLLRDMWCLLPYCYMPLLFMSEFFFSCEHFPCYTPNILHSVTVFFWANFVCTLISVGNCKQHLHFVYLRSLKYILKPETSLFYRNQNLFL
jgi:hypothetical protein